VLDELLNYLITNTYAKLPYLKVRQADPIAEIKAVLAADDLGQHALGLDGDAGNALAIKEMRDYLHMAASQNRVLLSDVLNRFLRHSMGMAARVGNSAAHRAPVHGWRSQTDAGWI
jgi:hypothetical protein